MTTLTERAQEATWSERRATFAMFLALGLGVGVWAAALPGLKANLSLSDRELSFALTAVAIGSFVSTVATGVIAPRFGTGRATGVSAIAVAIAFMLPAFAQNIVQLSGFALLIGLSLGALDISVNGHASDVERRWRRPIMSSFHAAFSIGGLLGSALGGLLAWGGWGVSGQIVIPMGCTALMVIGVAPTLGVGRRETETRGLGLALPERRALVLCGVVMFCFAIEGAIADWSAVYLATEAHASAWASAAGYAGFSITMAVGRLIGDGVVHAFGARHVVLFGGLIASLGLALAVLFAQPLPVTIGFALVGIGLANVVPVVFSAAGRFGSSPSAGVAMVATVGYAGFLGGPPIIGAIASWAGLRMALGLVLLAAILVALGGFKVEEPDP